MGPSEASQTSARPIISAARGMNQMSTMYDRAMVAEGRPYTLVTTNHVIIQRLRLAANPSFPK